MVSLIIWVLKISVEFVYYMVAGVISAFGYLGRGVVFLLEHTIGRVVPTIVVIAAVGVPAYLVCFSCFTAGVLSTIFTGQMTPPPLAESPELCNACLAVMVIAGVCWWLSYSQAGRYVNLCERCDSGKISSQKLEAHKRRLYGDVLSLVGRWPRPLQCVARACFSL